MLTRTVGSICVGVVLCGCASAPRWSGYTVEAPDRREPARPDQEKAGSAFALARPGRPGLATAGWASSGDDCTTSLSSSSGSTPTEGMLDLPDHLKWGEVVLPAFDAQHPERRALYARTPTSGGLCMTLVAGAFGPSDASDVCDRGISPPIVEKSSDPYWRGLFLDSMTEAGQRNRDLLYLRAGFLVVSIKPGSPVAWPMPWPIIIRTPGLPGGAYAGTAVFVAVRSSTGGPLLRECVYRPNQSGCACDGWPKPEGDCESKVFVDSYGDNGREPHVLGNVSYVELKGGAAREVKALTALDSQFLIDACTFADQVQKHNDAEHPPEYDRSKWKCTVDGTPKAQGPSGPH